MMYQYSWFICKKKYGISLGNVCGVCIGGATTMSGCRSKFQRFVMDALPKAIGIHYVIHRQVLATKTLSQEFQVTIKNVVSGWNFVKSGALNSRLFLKLCRELDAFHNVLLFHTKVRWF
uniref:SCAN domain-containing protein 3 (Trinotate prediction) n=1 Tax=Henneguya salminicola TaxID=69463 RepID=A0A6G3MLW8_HENSL